MVCSLVQVRLPVWPLPVWPSGITRRHHVHHPSFFRRRFVQWFVQLVKTNQMRDCCLSWRSIHTGDELVFFPSWFLVMNFHWNALSTHFGRIPIRFWCEYKPEDGSNTDVFPVILFFCCRCQVCLFVICFVFFVFVFFLKTILNSVCWYPKKFFFFAVLHDCRSLVSKVCWVVSETFFCSTSS